MFTINLPHPAQSLRLEKYPQRVIPSIWFSLLSSACYYPVYLLVNAFLCMSTMKMPAPEGRGQGQAQCLTHGRD